MKPTSTIAFGPTLAATVAIGAPGGALIILLFWWLLTSVTHPALASEWWEYALVATYLLGPVWAPLLAGSAVLRLAARLGWAERFRDQENPRSAALGPIANLGSATDMAITPYQPSRR